MKEGQELTDNVVRISFGSLCLSRISYRCDLQRAGGLVIPLGVMAELAVGPVRVLGLIARSSLNGNELPAVGRMVRDKLAKPFEFLKSDFDWAWQRIEDEKIEPRRVLALLAERYSDSVFFAAQREQRVRVTAETALQAMRQARDEDFYAMLDELGRPTMPPTKDISELEPNLAAA